MNTLEINTMLKNKKYFQGAFCLDKLPYKIKRPLSLIINTDPCSQPGQHWVAILLHKNGTGDYFDSFGMPPIHQEIINYLNFNCKKWNYNKKTIQDLTSDCCGLYCVLYIKFDGKINHLFTQDTKMNDIIVKGYIKNDRT